MALDPSDSEVIRDAITARLGEVWTATIGRVQKYDAVTQTADILPVVRRAIQAGDGTIGHEELPVIPNVPVLQARAGGFFVNLPVDVGDTMLVVFTSSSFQMWRESGSVVDPGDLRRHSLSNAIAIPGVFPSTKPISPVDAAASAGGAAILGEIGGAQLRFGPLGIEFAPSGVTPIAPVALAPAVLTAFAALATYVAALTSALVANPVAYSGFATAMAAPGATLATALGGLSGTVPSTLVKSV